MEQLKDQYQFVMSFFDDDGENLDKLSASQEWEVYCLGDGLGTSDPEKLLQMNGGWDINHIRNSSKSAVNNMALRIAEIRQLSEKQ